MCAFPHHWLFPRDIEQAKAAQQEMAERVLIEDALEKPMAHLAGVDMSNTPFDPKAMIFGSIVVLSYPSLEIVETATRADKQEFPYIPGLLGFREVPLLIEMHRQLAIKPEVILVDGHGISHPRGLGIASHLGILLDTATIGVAKSILIGKPSGPLAEEVGSQVSLQWKGKSIGRMLRTKKRSSPLIISIGHKISLETAVSLVLSCLKGYRLPEPTRHAHLAANICRKNFVSSFL